MSESILASVEFQMSLLMFVALDYQYHLSDQANNGTEKDTLLREQCSALFLFGIMEDSPSVSST